MRKEELNAILHEHKLWLEGKGGQRADLRNADLSYANLSYANLSYAYLTGAALYNADLSYADLSYASLSHADLTGTNLSVANLRYANLSDANLSYADLRNADLSYANLSYANLSHAYLSGANLTNANLTNANFSGTNLSSVNFDEKTSFFALQCPEKGSFIGFKKVNDKIVELEIPAESRRSSATTRKCRCEFAKVLSITNLDGSDAKVKVIVNFNFGVTEYKIGEMVYSDKWDNNRWNECSHGIHFFITREEAVNY